MEISGLACNQESCQEDNPFLHQSELFLRLLFIILQIDELLKQRNEIHASYTAAPPMKRTGSSRSKSRNASKDVSEDGHVKDKKPSRDRSKKKKWFNIHLKVDKRKSC